MKTYLLIYLTTASRFNNIGAALIYIFAIFYIFCAAWIAWKVRKNGYPLFSWLIFILSIVITPLIMWLILGDSFSET